MARQKIYEGVKINKKKVSLGEIDALRANCHIVHTDGRTNKVIYRARLRPNTFSFEHFFLYVLHPLADFAQKGERVYYTRIFVYCT